MVAGPAQLTGAAQEPAPPLEVEAVFDRVLSTAARLFQGEGGSIMLRVGDDDLEVVASPANPAALGATVRIGVGISGRVARTCEPVLVSGRINERTNAVDSSVCLPLIHDGELFGLLNINARPVHIFTNNDLEAGTAFGRHAADALVSARRYELARADGDPEPQRHLDAMEAHFAAAASVDFIGPVARDEVDLGAIVRSVAAAETRGGRETIVRGGDDAIVLSEGKAVRRLVQELVDNAHRHGAGPVRLLVEARIDAVELTVTDHGAGIPADERARVLDPFVRLGAAADGDGLGLGLTIAVRLAEATDGTIAVSDMPAGGAAVTVRLPRA